TASYTRISYGVVLETLDGGKTWSPLVAPPASVASPAGRRISSKTADKDKIAAPPPSLPRIRKVQFFSREEGVAVGEGTGNNPTGVFATADGGKSWRALPGKLSAGWLAATFHGPDAGILVGAGGSRALAIEGKIVVPPRFEPLGVRGL